MTINYKSLFIKLTIIMLVFNSQITKAQCNLTYYAGIGVANTGTTFSTWANFGPGQYFAFPVLNGGSYDISTCGAPINTQITGWDASASSVIFYNDDNGPFCSGSAASVSGYVPNFTNYMYVQVTESNCASGGTSSINLYLRQNDNIVFTSSAASMCSGQTRNLTATPANVGSTPGGYGNPGTFSGTGVSGNVFTAPVVATTTNYTITYTFGYVSHSQVITVNPKPTVTASATNSVVCNSQAVTLNGGGASTYTWTGGVTNGVAFTPGTTSSYSVTGTSALGCLSSNTAVVTVSVNPAIITSTAVTNVACNGGSTGAATITAAGGTSPYSYLASNGSTLSAQSGLVAGTYNYTVTDAYGCTKTQGLTINQPTALVTTTAVTNVACNGGSNGVASISASGGAGGYTYLWSNGVITSVASGLLAGAYTATVTDANSCTSIKAVTVTQPSAIVTTTAVTNVACNGGSNGVAAITASGGAGGYTYLWSNGGTTSAITGLMAGAYTATVTDANSCTSVKAVTVTQPTALATTTAIANVLCNGGSTGSATITATGGTGAYTYLWSNGATTPVASGLVAGAYSATVTDANSCTSAKAVTVTQPTALATTTAVTNVLCNGGSTGSATITASGGAGGYTYLWSNGGTTSAITGLMAGAYTATVTDANSCTSTKAVTVTQPTALATTTAVANVLCNGGSTGSATITATGGTGAYTYLWSNGATTSAVSSLLAGAYSATVTDANACTSTKAVTVTQPTALATTSAVTNVLCNGGTTGSATVTATGGTGAYTYLWSNGAITSAASGLVAGVYSATVTDANNCTSVNSVTVIEPTVLNVSSTSSAILCNGGVSTITVSAVDGTSPYTGVGTYTMTAGSNTYTVTDANGCSATTSITVSEPAVLNVSSTSSAILCNGGVSTITVSAVDGTSPYTGVGTYTMTAGSNTYTVTDANGCSATTSITVSEPTVLNVSSTVSSSVICADGVATITVNAVDGTSPYTGTGSYTVNTSSTSYTVTDANGCFATTNVSLTVNALPTLVAVTSNTLLCSGETATLSVSGATSYTWSTNESTPDIAVTPMVQTTYTVNGTDANGCSNSTTITQDVSLCTGLSSITGTDVQLINVYPNPNIGLFTIELNYASRVVITNAIGEVIVSETMEAGKHNLDIQNKASGIYFVKVIYDEKQSTIKLIKQ